MKSQMAKVKHLIVDSGAFIKNAPVHEYAENVYTVPGAIKEIRDKATRQRLQFLPYTLKIKEPSPEAYKHVLEFSKRTGDFATLSVVDLQIVALTYQLEKENVGTHHLNTEPMCKVTNRPCFEDSKLSGFYYPQKISKQTEKESSDNSLENLLDGDDEISNEEVEQELGKDSEVSEGNGNEISKKQCEENLFSEDTDNDEDSEEGWITLSNIAEMQKKMGAMVLDENSSVSVACISTDFAIQNVLIQIGLHILSVDGMLIKNARVFILRCFACFKTTTDTSKKFCSNCGNKTLKRVAVSYNEEGSQTVHINFKKPINIRGTRYSLPMPKGGKHSMNPILCEDQPIPHNRPSKMSLQKFDALSPEYDVMSSPFVLNDVYSRAASLGIRSNKSGRQKKNPNDWSIRTGNRKRNK